MNKITVNKCLGCGVNVYWIATGDSRHERGCPVKAHRDEYNRGLRKRLDSAKRRR